MGDAEQPTRLKRVGAGLGWAGLVIATVLAIFFLVPLGASESLSASSPTTSSAPEDVPGSTNPETWVLSSTVVTSTPHADELDDPASADAQAEAEAKANAALPYADRSTPSIIQVPATSSAAPATTRPTAVPSRTDTSRRSFTADDSSTTRSSATTTSAGPTTTCVEAEPTPDDPDPAEEPPATSVEEDSAAPEGDGDSDDDDEVTEPNDPACED